MALFPVISNFQYDFVLQLVPTGGLGASLLRAADIALQRAKLVGADTFRFFTAEEDASAARRMVFTLKVSLVEWPQN